MAIIAIMAMHHTIYALHPSKDLDSSPASELKNAFRSVFQQALKAGAISITRNRKREAILLSVELYDQIVTELAARDPLKALRKDYDTRFHSMQTDESKAAYENAFNASPEELGKAAVDQAAGQ